MSAVIGITLIAGLGVALFIFKDKIASFASGGLTDIGTNISGGIDQAGKDLEQFGKDQQKAFDDFVLQTQGAIDKSLSETQQGIGQFFQDSQTNLNQSIAGIQTGIDDTLKGITDPLDQFGKDAQKNIADANKGILDFFGSFFGGQNPPKEITKEIKKTPTNTSNTGRTDRDFPERFIAPFVLPNKDQTNSVGIQNFIDTGKFSDPSKLSINPKGTATTRPFNLSEFANLPKRPTKPTTISNKTLLAQQELSKKFGITTFDLKGNATFKNGIAVGSITDTTQKEVEAKSANKPTRFGRPTLTNDLINTRPIENPFSRRTSGR